VSFGIQTAEPAIAQFAGDYFQTFARLLDPKLPSARNRSCGATAAFDWSAGQASAFATICLLAATALLVEIILFCA